MCKLSHVIVSILVSLSFAGVTNAQIVLNFPPPPIKPSTEANVKQDTGQIALAGYLYNRSTPRWNYPIGNWLYNAYRVRINAALYSYGSYGNSSYIGYPIGFGYYPFYGSGFGFFGFGTGHHHFGSASGIHFGFSNSNFHFNIDL